MTPADRTLLTMRLRAVVDACPEFAPMVPFIEHEAERAALTVLGLAVADPQKMSVSIDYDWPGLPPFGVISPWEKAETYRKTTITFGSESQRGISIPTY
jgi:hypothetical protein